MMEIKDHYNPCCSYLLPATTVQQVWTADRHLGNGVKDNESEIDMPSVMELGGLQWIKGM